LNTKLGLVRDKYIIKCSRVFETVIQTFRTRFMTQRRQDGY